jgi:hypothetical protein
MKYKILILLILMQILSGCFHKTNTGLYEGFVNPPAEARPFVRWWWNGNRVTEKEIIRQLDVLHEAGIGGVEINPIKVPEWCDTSGTKALTWLSPEWNRILAFTSEEAHKRGMITDLIVGSGWPFGGEFLNEDELIQRVIINTIECKGGDLINKSFRELINMALKSQSVSPEGKASPEELMFIRLVPENLHDVTEIIDLKALTGAENNLSYKVPQGRWHLIYGILVKGYRHVQYGVPGAAGVVMDHYRKEITLAYLNRLKKISEDTGIPLNKLIRALFCDSIELAGANWTDGFDEIFLKTYGYDPEPWFPFIFYDPNRGYGKEKMKDDFSDRVKRVRYDYNKLLVNVFLDNFTQTFQDFCKENGLLCRYQAYGTPFLMGMMEGNMIPDIPESNNWLYSVNMETDEWIWNKEHGYMIWNLYAASGGHLKGRKIISCEAMTNTRGVFKTTLEEIKRHDDMNFITGINHSILHGYNYSPAEAGFPGWIRFGTYFSEKNTWWPYFRRWTDYNARLSYIFQNTQPVKNIAIIGPTGDVWSEYGLTRVPFHITPWYCYSLWEPLSQAGSSCDYVDENVIAEAVKENGIISYGPMSYQALILCNVKSVEPQTAEAIAEFIKSGGKTILAGSVPGMSLSLVNAEEDNIKVRKIFDDLLKEYPDRIFLSPEPASPETLLQWTKDALKKLNIKKDLEISDPSPEMFQIRHVLGQKDIWFIVNPDMKKTTRKKVVFPTGNKIPWKWDPETGKREIFSYNEIPSVLNIELKPLESLLLVFETGKLNTHEAEKPEAKGDTVLVITGPWEVDFHHINGNNFSLTFDEFEEFGTSADGKLNSFAGTVYYKITFDSDGRGKWLSLNNLNRGIAEVFLNGVDAGVCWYGKPEFNISSLLKQGENTLLIKYTSTLSNYVRTLKVNPAAVRWTKGYTPVVSGLSGKVVILN